MKLLFDNNLSHKLVGRLDDLYPDSSHVMLEGLDQAEDHANWDLAKANGFIIVTKDSDFNELSIMKGCPPKVIWLRMGNSRVSAIEHIIREHALSINTFLKDLELGILEMD